jgi:hypothetical protein
MIVNNSNNFHVDLHRYRPNDYAGLSRYLGSSYLNMVNKLVYPVHFNHVQVNNTKVKYAVIDIDTFVHDLTTWKMLTFAGRMHKPVAYNILNTPQPEKLIRSVSNNHRMALNVGLLSMIGRIRDN